ncbi:MAG TPA: CU044_5270 family protein [Solirubrobacteraceae bacterium]|jgi:hypothetical protein|nr:CU044_5270 family protein [Solirubrobacteraceae bacterium]
MTDELPILDELERRLLAGCYAPGRARRGRRPGWPWAALGGLLVAGAVAAALLVGSGSVGPPPASALSDAAAAIARGPARAPLRAGQYWYTRTVTSIRAPLPIIPRTIAPGRPPTAPALVELVTRESAETWIGLDGTLRTRTIRLSSRFASAAGRARWLASGAPLPGANPADSITAGDGRFPPQASGGFDVGDGLLTYAQLLALPTDPKAVLQRVEAAQKALAGREAAAFKQSIQNAPGASVSQTVVPLEATGSAASAKQGTAIDDLQTIAELLTAPLPTAVRAALFRAVATIPGVTYTSSARDPLGRAGAAVTVGRGPGQVRLVFDPRTGALLANVEGSVSSSTVVVQGVVDSIRALPAGVAPVPGAAGLAPQTITVSPRTGTTTSSFALTLTSTTSGTARPALFSLSGPAGPGCQASLPRMLSPPVRQGPAGPGQTGSTYEFTAGEDGRATWCRGRYEIQIIGTGRGGSNGPAGAVYFEVK